MPGQHLPEDHVLGEFAEGEPDTTALRWGIAATMQNIGIDPTDHTNSELVKELERYFIRVSAQLPLQRNHDMKLNETVDEAALIANADIEIFDTDAYTRSMDQSYKLYRKDSEA